MRGKLALSDWALKLTGKWHDAAEYFWRTVRERRTVAIGGNNVKQHFHNANSFAPMISDVEGPETYNTYSWWCALWRARGQLPADCTACA